MHVNRLIVVGSLLACSRIGWAAGPTPYVFEKLAETGSTHSSLGVPALNDAGIVAFAGGGTTSGVYYGRPSGIQRLDTPGLSQVGGPVDITNAGRIAFVAGDARVFWSDPGGPIREIEYSRADTARPTGLAMNDSNRIAFVTDSGLAPPGSSLFISDGTAPATHIITWAGPSAMMNGPHMNEAGHVVAAVDSGIFLHGAGTPSAWIVQNGAIDPDTGISGRFFSFRGVDTGDGGRVVFFSHHDHDADIATPNPYALWMWQNGTITKVPGSDGLGLSSVAAVNDRGAIAAFVGGGPSGPDRISLFDGGEHPVISVGDTFDGSTVRLLEFNAEGFNDVGQIAFRAVLADGRLVVALATVPEPTAAALLIASSVLLRRRPRVYRT